MSPLLNPSVPVRLEDSWAGFASNSGLLRLEGESLVLDFETRDELLNMLKSGVKRLALPLKEIETCRWVPGWFGGKIELSLRDMRLLEGIAGASQGRLKLTVARRDRDLAFGLVTNIDLALANRIITAAEDSGCP